MQLRYIRAFLAVVILAGCSECPPDTEPVMRLSFDVRPPQTPPRFTRVYGIGGQGDIPLPANDTLRLPLSLLADSVTYVFEQANGRRDTLVLCYERRIDKFRYGSRECGYSADIQGDSFIYGRADSLSIRNLPNLWKTSRTTFSRGRVEYRTRRLGTGLRNIFQAQIEP